MGEYSEAFVAFDDPGRTRKAKIGGKRGQSGK
jgi:hypothetical protein